MTCWTCGGKTPSFTFTCSSCEQTRELKKIRETLKSSDSQSLQAFVDFSAIEEDLFEISNALYNISSVIEWGFEEIKWKLEQTIGVLESIDKTLKTPSQTQANERRLIAEQLRERGVLGKSEEFFLKSLDGNPLDYRSYIGIAKTYIQLGNLEKAMQYLKESFPHAPKGEIDYRSYSYRLIGRIYFCKKDYNQAALSLKSAVELSPKYPFAHYDHAIYSCLIGNDDNCLNSLKSATEIEQGFIRLAKAEIILRKFKNEIEELVDQEYLDWAKLLKDADMDIEITRFKKVLEDSESYYRSREKPWSATDMSYWVKFSIVSCYEEEKGCSREDAYVIFDKIKKSESFKEAIDKWGLNIHSKIRKN